MNYLHFSNSVIWLLIHLRIKQLNFDFLHLPHISMIYPWYDLILRTLNLLWREDPISGGHSLLESLIPDWIEFEIWIRSIKNVNEIPYSFFLILGSIIQKLTFGVRIFESNSRSSSASSSSCPTPDSSEIGSSGFCKAESTLPLELLLELMLFPLSLAPRNPSKMHNNSYEYSRLLKYIKIK